MKLTSKGIKYVYESILGSPSFNNKCNNRVYTKTKIIKLKIQLYIIIRKPILIFPRLYCLQISTKI